MNEAIKPKKINLTGKIIWLNKDYLGKSKHRFYLVFKDENGKQVEAFPITSKIEYKDNKFRYLCAFCRPKLPNESIVLTDKEFKYFIERSFALSGLEEAKKTNYEKVEYHLKNHKEIFKQIKEYSEK